MKKEVNNRLIKWTAVGIFALLITTGCSTRSDDVVVVDSSLNTDGFNEVTPISGSSLEWKVTGDNNDTLEVRATAPTTGWVSVGFATSGSKMGSSSAPVNVVFGDIDGSTVTLTDAVSTGLSAPATDGTQNVTAVTDGSSEANGTTIIHFTIPLNSGDSQDVALTEGGDVDFLFAYHDSSSSLTSKHSSRVRLSTQKL